MAAESGSQFAWLYKAADPCRSTLKVSNLWSPSSSISTSYLLRRRWPRSFSLLAPLRLEAHLFRHIYPAPPSAETTRPSRARHDLCNLLISNPRPSVRTYRAWLAPPSATISSRPHTDFFSLFDDCHTRPTWGSDRSVFVTTCVLFLCIHDITFLLPSLKLAFHTFSMPSSAVSSFL